MTGDIRQRASASVTIDIQDDRSYSIHMPRQSLKEQIVAKGAAFIAANGFTASGVGEITQAAGVPKGSFYNHFSSKEAFGLEILERYYAQAAENASAALGDEGLRPIDRLKAYIEMMTAHLGVCDWSHGCLMGNFVLEAGCGSEAIRERLTSMFGDWSARIAACISEAQKAGEISRETDPAMLADFMINAWEGAVLRMKVERTRKPLDDCKTVLFATVFT